MITIYCRGSFLLVSVSILAFNLLADLGYPVSGPAYKKKRNGRVSMDNRVKIKKGRGFGIAGIVILVILISVSFLAPIIAPYNPYERTGLPFQKPGMEHLLGCNDVGHDLFSELLYGGRISLFIGLFASIYATVVATTLALLAGYVGGSVDRVIMRIVDVVMSLPFLPLVIVLGVFLGSGIMDANTGYYSSNVGTSMQGIESSGLKIKGK